MPKKKPLQDWEKRCEERKAQWARERLARIEAMGDTPERYIYEYLGYNGHMISGSKSGYGQAYPRNVAIFNSNVVTIDKDGKIEKIWYGDIDLTTDETKLVQLAQKLGKEVRVLREMDGRFENETAPKTDRYCFRVEPGWVDGQVGPSLEDYVERAKRGKLAAKLVYKKNFR